MLKLIMIKRNIVSVLDRSFVLFKFRLLLLSVCFFALFDFLCVSEAYVLFFVM